MGRQRPGCTARVFSVRPEPAGVEEVWRVFERVGAQFALAHRQTQAGLEADPREALEVMRVNFPAPAHR